MQHWHTGINHEATKSAKKNNKTKNYFVNVPNTVRYYKDPAPLALRDLAKSLNQ